MLPEPVIVFDRAVKKFLVIDLFISCLQNLCVFVVARCCYLGHNRASRR